MMLTRQIRQWAAAGVVPGVVALCGCGSDPEPATSSASSGVSATVAPAAALPSGLRGSWRRTMRARDWRPAGGGYPVGTFRLDVAPDGAVSVYFPNVASVDFTTQFAVDGRRLTIETVPVCPTATGSYRWHASASELRLTVVDDPQCKPRAALFAGTWTRRR